MTTTMTKTETRRLVADLRREAVRITTVLTPTPAWILQEMGREPLSQASIERTISDALDNIDGISAMLREGLVSQ